MNIVAGVITLCVLGLLAGLIYNIGSRLWDRLDDIAGGLSGFLLYGLVGSLAVGALWVGIGALGWALGK